MVFLLCHALFSGFYTDSFNPYNNLSNTTEMPVIWHLQMWKRRPRKAKLLACHTAARWSSWNRKSEFGCRGHQSAPPHLVMRITWGRVYDDIVKSHQKGIMQDKGFSSRLPGGLSRLVLSLRERKNTQSSVSLPTYPLTFWTERKSY